MLRDAGDEIERGREVTPEIVEAMKERGIFRMLLPRSLGGAELDPLTYTEVLYTLAQGDGSPAWCLGQNSGCSMIAPYLPEETAREVFGDRDGILAWGPDLPGAGRGVVVEGGYRAHRALGFRDRQPARQMARLPHVAVRARRQPAQIAERPPAGAHDGVPANPRRRSSTTGRSWGCAAPAATAMR